MFKCTVARNSRFPIQQLFFVMRSSSSLLCGIRRRAFDSLKRLVNFNKKIFNSISHRKRYKSVYLSFKYSFLSISYGAVCWSGHKSPTFKMRNATSETILICVPFHKQILMLWFREKNNFFTSFREGEKRLQWWCFITFYKFSLSSEMRFSIN